MAFDNWQRISFRAAADTAPPKIDFCLPNLLAGSVGTVAAEPGIGKTSLLLQLGAAVAAGIPVANGAIPKPEGTGKVVFLAAEDPPRILQRRAHFLVRSLEAQGCGRQLMETLETSFHLFSVVGHAPVLIHERGISNSAWNELSNVAAGARLVILDPIRSFHWCEDQDYRNMSLLYQILVDIASARDCTILFSHHASRCDLGSSTDESDAARGLSAFVNPTRWVLNMRTMSEQEARARAIDSASRRDYVQVTIPKSNYGPPVAPIWLHRSVQFEGIFERAALPEAARAQ